MNPAMMPPIGKLCIPFATKSKFLTLRVHIHCCLLGMPQPGIGGMPPFDLLNQKAELKTEESEEAKLEKKRKADAERKKEEEEKAKQASAKPQDKSRPVSSTPIAGTPWCVVWTGDGKVFFYNPSSRTSVWDRPEDLVGRADVDKAIATAPEQLAVPANPVNPFAKKTETEIGDNGGQANKEDKDDVEMADATTADEEIASGKRSESESSGEADVPAKKLKLSENAVKATGEKKDLGKEAVIEAEVRAARERALVPLETRVQQFKDMLKEKDVCIIF